MSNELSATQLLELLWNKNINISALKGSIFIAGVWDDDWNYGYEHYCDEYNNLTKEEYMNIIAFIKKNHKDE